MNEDNRMPLAEIPDRAEAHGGLYLGRLAGIPIYIDYSWFIIFALLTYSLAATYFPQVVDRRNIGLHWLLGGVASLLLFASVLAHELMHSVVARRNRIPISGITLFVFGGASEMTEEPETPMAEFKMAFVGPLTSLILAVIFYALAVVAREYSWGILVTAVSSYLFFINLLLAVFNLVPGFPLDGGRVLRSIIWGASGNLTKATRAASYVGIAFAYVLIFLGVVSVLGGNYGGIWLVLVGWFLQNAAQRSYQQLLLRRTLDKVAVKRIMTPDVITINGEVPLDQAVEEYFFRYKHAAFPVVEEGSVIGLLVFNDVKDVPREQWPKTTARQAARPLTRAMELPADADAYEALESVARGDIGRVLIMDEGRLAGIVSRRDLTELIRMKQETDGTGRIE